MPEKSRIKFSSLRLTSLVDLIGRKTIGAFSYLIDVCHFIFKVFRSSRSSQRGKGFSRQSVSSQILFSGIDALPTITILGLAIGLAVTAQFILLLQDLTSEREVITLLNQLMAQELAPLITAIVLIGRTGSAITVDLGNMSIHREIRALELLGVNVHEVFVLPRILGVAISQFALAVYFAGIVMVAGIIFAALLDSPSNYKYLFLLGEAFNFTALIQFLIKNLLFGLFIGAIACLHGLRAEFSLTELPQQTQRSIVNSMIFVFLIDGLMVALQ
jgi:phospholipid/cholesterol/gamma-HCH transport system permease protein